mmetsp:Transcript_4871/g.10764  ORF Transcript_4871/g.10764 Transcript_4871/m.10764 type:complete len:214 (+) Transcript_4871:117-758(+)|eukprot:CAMPEP_0171327516 /NCGR_PEP_ID=MMETSP0878-20121228/38_1 /TAXON_ID=67004 /ORGANISM="Thalassiosira weissflogii, Strain CCMP1336" /LENGTH=213 /DNA_ID=CAMNT_0011827285 /DNA_START=60 /DNA_END=701 /DNA_ORIENTATION=+
MFSHTAAKALRSTPSTLTKATRAMSTAANPHKPPLDLYGLPARYANATYIAASKSSSLPAVEAELLAIRATAASSSSFKSFLENPLISRDAKTKQIQEMLGDKFSPVTVNLMTTLAGNARLSAINPIVDDYVKLMKAKRGEVEATIISAEPLTKTQTEAVANAMKGQFPEGAKVVLSSKVDPAILGGLQIQIGDKFLDLSVGSRIEEVSRMAV